MEVLGIGPLELMLIAIVAMLVIKPEDWGNTGRTVAKWINQITSSDVWRAMNESWRAASEFSTDLKREVNLDRSLKELDDLTRAPYSTNPARYADESASSLLTAGRAEPNVIFPPHSKPYVPNKSVQPAKTKAAASAKATLKKPANKKPNSAAPKKRKPKKTNA